MELSRNQVVMHPEKSVLPENTAVQSVDSVAAPALVAKTSSSSQIAEQRTDMQI